jgi:leader peptidase (prepilin peptidase)/N-methyltransferase
MSSAFAIAVAGVFGLALGSFLNVVVTRVPHRESLLTPSHCRSCRARISARHNVPVVSWLALRGRCHVCRAPISPRYPLLEAGTGIVFATVTAWTGSLDSVSGAARWLLAAGLCGFAAISIALALVDLATHRLPDMIVAPGYLLAGASLTGTSAASGDWSALARGAVGLVVLALGYGGVHAIRPDAMGFGDVKLAGLVGLVTAYLGWQAWAVGAFAAFVLAGGYGAFLLATGRAHRRSALAFGPWMLAGGWLGLVAGAPLASGYLHVTGLAA